MPGTVYVLGAGASRAATATRDVKAPLAAEFFKEEYLKEFWYDMSFGTSFKDSALSFVLSRYFSSDTKRGGFRAEAINIEEVYSFLHSLNRVFQSSTYKREDFELARRQLHQYIIAVVRYACWNVEDLGFLTRLVGNLEEEDSIITFNWDTLVEQAIRKSKNQHARELLDLQVKSPDSHRFGSLETWDARYRVLHRGRLIKVHGSVSYTYCQNVQCVRHQLPYNWEVNIEFPEHWSCDECGSPTDVMILPPHGAKTYAASNFFRLQASMAAEKLAMASKIVFIGYSIPVFDIEARSMLRCARLDSDDSEAWLSEVIVVNPAVRNRRYAADIKNLLGVDNYAAHGHQVTFTGYSSIDAYEEGEQSGAWS